jgi:hypothetical protein
MSYYLHQAIPPTVEPVSLEDALTQCHADAGIEDEWFLARIIAGRKKVEDYTRRSLMPQMWVMTYDNNAPATVILPRPPVIEVKSVVVNGVALEPPFNVGEGLPNRLFLGPQHQGGSLRVEYVAGYTEGKIPQTMIDATLLFVSWAYGNREGETDIPKAFYDLIQPYKLST